MIKNDSFAVEVASLGGECFHYNRILDEPVAQLLERAKINNLGEIPEIVNHRRTIELGLDPKFENVYTRQVSPLGQLLRHSIKEFFLGDLIRLNRSKGHEAYTRPNSVSLGVQPFAKVKASNLEVSPIYLLRSRAYEEAFPVDSSCDKVEAFSLPSSERDYHNSPIRPLNLASREFFVSGDAGAIVALRDEPFALRIQAYWNEDAFISALQTLQNIGKDLFETAAIAKAELSGKGKTDFSKASSLLNKIYTRCHYYLLKNFPSECFKWAICSSC